MSAPVRSNPLRPLIPGAIALTIVGLGLWKFGPAILASYSRANLTPHWPNFALWNELHLQVQLHIAAAVIAFLIGCIVLMRPKGVGLHKFLGWAWVISMAATAITSLFITGLNGNFYSIIHLLSGWTLVALPLGIFAIRSRKVQQHRRTMTGIFFGGLLVAGALTLIPGRFMFEFFFGR